MKETLLQKILIFIISMLICYIILAFITLALGYMLNICFDFFVVINNILR